LIKLFAGNAVHTIEIGEVPDYLSLQVHGTAGDTIVHHLHCLADGANHFGGVASIGEVSAL